MTEEHVVALLAPFVDGELPAAERERVARHLEACARCRTAAERVRRGAEAARALEVEPLPRREERRILEAIRRETDRLEAGSAGGERRWPSRWKAVAAAAAAAGIAALVLVRAVPHVTAQPAEGPLTRLEAVALEARSELGAEPDRLDPSRLDLVTDSPADARRWLADRGLSAALALERPPEERERYALLGAHDLSAPDFRAAAVAYRIDGRPVLLVAARAAEVSGVPRWGLFGKRVLHREQDGVKLLTWTNSGKAYTLVSDLPELGQRACLICHTDAARRRVVERLGESAGELSSAEADLEL